MKLIKLSKTKKKKLEKQSKLLNEQYINKTKSTKPSVYSVMSQILKKQLILLEDVNNLIMEFCNIVPRSKWKLKICNKKENTSLGLASYNWKFRSSVYHLATCELISPGVFHIDVLENVEEINNFMEKLDKSSHQTRLRDSNGSDLKFSKITIDMSNSSKPMVQVIYNFFYSKNTSMW